MLAAFFTAQSFEIKLSHGCAVNVPSLKFTHAHRKTPSRHPKRQKHYVHNIFT